MPIGVWPGYGPPDRWLQQPNGGAGLHVRLDIPVVLVMIPAALSASCAFMMPVVTVPNTVMFSTYALSTGRMAQEGLALNFIGIAVIGLVRYLRLA